MTDRLDALLRLRARDVDRGARGTAAATDVRMRADGARSDAAHAQDAASATLGGALAARLLRPADPRLQDYLAACEARVADADRALELARQAQAAAEQAETEARRAWLRAQVRHDVLGDRIAGVRREERRARDRRVEDAVQRCRAGRTA